MRKTMMIAAALLTLGTGAAFANDGDVFVPQLDGVTVQQQQAPATAQQQAPAHRIFATTDRATTSVYDLFSRPGYTQGGEN
ncbi:MAG: hypothetical protein BGO51_24680 [Rhodospirillales bacterium 69-11]|nr:hypothetical protein [Rhodospirillales bacterium]OJW28102.1 MAG: hypothetical protein BGO51_24680 [Rhodospirillales bacterium 69-11]